MADAVAAGDPSRLASLTFDDGFASDASPLLPLLQELGVPATIFVVAEWLGGPHREFDWARIYSGDELRELHQHGVEIGSHSATHPHLSSLSFDEAKHELARSRALLESVIDAPVRVLAYPYGDANTETRQAVRAAGYKAACRFRGEGSWDDLYDLPRQPMGWNTGTAALRLKRDNRYESLMNGRALSSLRSLVWMIHRT